MKRENCSQINLGNAESFFSSSRALCSNIIIPSQNKDMGAIFNSGTLYRTNALRDTLR